MAFIERTIHIHPAAPVKVAAGAPCNGCGVCCLLEPCPLGMLISSGRDGPCRAVRWEPLVAQYRCGAIMDAQDVLANFLPRGTRWLAPALAPILRRLAQRWIAAGIGCDGSVEVVLVRQDATNSSDLSRDSTTMAYADLTNQKHAVVSHPPP